MAFTRRFGHAVVIGGSMAGLFTARILSKHFKSVTLFDRDQYVDAPEPRKGAPQGRHIHVLMNGGYQFASEYFPGVMRQMQDSGGNLRSWGNLAWFFYGMWPSRISCDLPVMQCSRPFMEWHFRRRVFKLHNVTVNDQTKVKSLLSDACRERVTGVVVQGPNGQEEEVHADLVMDVSGRGSKAEQWLYELGYQPPPRSEVTINLAYTSRLYERPEGFPEDLSWLALYPRQPDQKRAGFIFEIENGRFIVSLNGYFGDHCPLDHEGFLAFAKSLPKPDIYDWIKDAKPLTEATRFKVKSSLRRRYEKLDRFPAGYAVTGDAHCSFNPVFGQGMSAAALSARALDRALTEHPSEDLAGFSQRFFKLQARALEAPWLVTTSADLRYKEAVGRRLPGLTLLNAYVGLILELSSTNPRIYNEFLKVFHMRTGLWSLVKPTTLIPTLAYGMKSLILPLHKRARTGAMPAVIQPFKADGTFRPPAPAAGMGPVLEL